MPGVNLQEVFEVLKSQYCSLKAKIFLDNQSKFIDLTFRKTVSKNSYEYTT